MHLLLVGLWSQLFMLPPCRESAAVIIILAVLHVLRTASAASILADIACGTTLPMSLSKARAETSCKGCVVFSDKITSDSLSLNRGQILPLCLSPHVGFVLSTMQMALNCILCAQSTKQSAVNHPHARLLLEKRFVDDATPMVVYWEKWPKRVMQSTICSATQITYGTWGPMISWTISTLHGLQEVKFHHSWQTSTHRYEYHKRIVVDGSILRTQVWIRSTYA